MPTPTIEEILIIAEVEGVTAARKDLDELTESTAKADKEGKKYEKTLGDMAKETTVFGVSLNGLSGGFKSSLSAIKASTTGLKAFRIALASTGIGLLVIALGSVVAWLKTTVAGAEFLEDAFAAIGTIVDTLVGGLVNVAKGLGQIFSGNFLAGLKQVTTSFDGMNEALKRNVQTTLELTEARRKLDEQAFESNVLIAQSNQELAKQKRIQEDVTAATVDRIEANRLAGEELKRVDELQSELLQKRQTNNSKEIANEATTSLRRKELEEENFQVVEDLINLQTANIERSIELQNKGNDLRKQHAQEETDRVALAKQEGITIGTIRKKEVEDIEGVTEKIIDGNLERTDSDIKYWAGRDERREADLLEEERVAEATVGLFKTTLNAIGTALGKSAAAAKALAIFNATLDAGLAIGKAIASAPWPANIPALGVAIAAGANLIATIRQAAEPNIPSYGKGGLINGPSHTNGGMMANLEGGETVINAKSSKMFRQELSAMNVAGGGIPFMQLGGVIPQTVGATPFRDLELIAMQNRTVLVTEDLQAVERRTLVTEVLTTL